ncbi:MAG: glycosyltransferase family 4 protein [Clostridia bacterium]|nr:glycosyltransferase family 4 protein [Clostridia bacterium]
MKENNRKTKVCIIRSNPVSPDSRVEKEALALARAGYDVHILAWDRGAEERESTSTLLLAGESIPITRLGHRAGYGEGLRSLRSYLGFQLHMRRWLSRRSFDIVHACDFDTAFFSCGVAGRRKSRFVFDIFDFLYDRPRGLLQKVVRRAQFWLINRADATIICTEQRAEQIAGAHPRRLAVVHNTPDARQLESLCESAEDRGRIRLVYVGILQPHRLLNEVIEAVSSREDIELHIGGFGKLEGYVREMADTCGNIYFYGRIPYARTLALEQSCHIMLALYDPNVSNHLYAAPNKFYESLMLGKPVMMVKGTGMSRVVEDFDLGELIGYSKEGFMLGIDKLLSRRGEWESMSERMKKLYRDSYSWEKSEKTLLKLYSELNDGKNTDSQ